MQTKLSARIIIALFSCAMLLCAFAAAPLMHKHSATEQVPLQDYDASCSFVKAEKGSAGTQTQNLLACISLLIFFIALQPLVMRRIDDGMAVRSIFTRKVQTPRAPPAC
ncbi:MAG: hypothetical protein JW832_05495 [Deltaproteobacteria bacterium]|nr:hypothetical protein [Deltaproteobacteria bacterium]